MKYLVTGGAGFIGSHIVEGLLKKGGEVTVLDNFETGNRKNLVDFLPDIEMIEGDIRDEGTVKSAMKGIDVVFHQAAVPSVPRSIREPLYTHDVNVNGTLTLLLGARIERVSRFVFASSSSIYGDTPTLPKTEDMAPSPLSPYAVQKLMGEYYVRVFYQAYSLPTVALRYFNVFGPRQDPNSEYAAVIPKFIDRILDKKPPVIYGDGTQSRDFTYIQNVVDANILASENGRCLGEVLNISTGIRFEIENVAERIGEVLGFDTSPIHDPPRDGDIKHSLGDISRAKKLLGYDVRVGFNEGLAATVKWYLDRAS